MSKLRIELNHEGMDTLLHSTEIQTELLKQGQAVQRRAGDNYQATALSLPSRCIVRVSAKNAKGVKDNLENNTLLKAVGK